MATQETVWRADYPSPDNSRIACQHWSIPKRKKGEILDDFDACFLSALW
jgi:hypothetical protein